MQGKKYFHKGYVIVQQGDVDYRAFRNQGFLDSGFPVVTGLSLQNVLEQLEVQEAGQFTISEFDRVPLTIGTELSADGLIGSQWGTAGSTAKVRQLRVRYRGAHALAQPYPDPISVVNALQQSMNEEQTAADWYRRRAEFSRQQGDWASAELWEHTAGEEDGHYNEFKDMKEKLERGFGG